MLKYANYCFFWLVCDCGIVKVLLMVNIAIRVKLINMLKSVYSAVRACVRCGFSISEFKKKRRVFLG